MKTIDLQLKDQPKNVLFCTRCVVSNQRPRTEFDPQGVCSACRYAEEKKHLIDWKARKRELVRLLNTHRSKKGAYDVIVPTSGGKDSGMVVHRLKADYGMHPLTITWAPFLYTDIGWKNYLNLKDAGFDNILCFPDGTTHRKLAQLAFELKGDPWEPFTWGQKSFAFHMALRFNIPLIFYGENGEVEYGGSMKNKNKSHESPRDWERLYFKGSGIDPLVAGTDLQKNNLMFYKPPAMRDIEKLGIQMHWWSYYHNWIPQENYYYAARHTGFEANPDGRSEGTYSKYASLDDKLDGFHWYLGYIKFGLGRASRDAQMEIRSGHITREEGVALVRRYDGEFPKKYFPEFLDYLDITEKEFWKVVDHYRPPHLWKKEKGVWKLRHQVS